MHVPVLYKYRLTPYPYSLGATLSGRTYFELNNDNSRYLTYSFIIESVQKHIKDKTLARPLRASDGHDSYVTIDLSEDV